MMLVAGFVFCWVICFELVDLRCLGFWIGWLYYWLWLRFDLLFGCRCGLLDCWLTDWLLVYCVFVWLA